MMNRSPGIIKAVVFLPVLFFAAMPLLAAAGGEEGGHGSYASTFLWIAVILIAAKVSGLVERVGQPAVLGELIIGVVLGNIALFGINVFEPLKSDSIVKFLAELGVVILLFQVGLESNIEKMRKVGFRAFSVACVGVAAPFVLGTWVVGPYLLPGNSFNTYLFVGAALTATSVGITARIFRDLKKLNAPEAQIVLGAAVIDDVIGLIILAVVSAIVTLGAVSLGGILWITAKAFIFLAAAIFLGNLAAPRVSFFFSKIHTGIGMKLGIALSFGLALAYGANEIGLAPIVGAFAAGLVLDPVHFRDFKDSRIVEDLREITTAGSDETTKKSIEGIIKYHTERHVEDLIEPIGMFLTPIFFVMTGAGVKLETFFNLPILLTALIITIIAFAGKIVSGLAAGKVNKWIVGWGMVPRGEVGLIFAAIGKELRVMSDEVFSVIVIVVILSTLLIPPVLTFLLKRHKD